MFTLVCEEAATLVLAGARLVNFIDLNVSEVVFSHERNAPQLWLSSKMCRTVRGVSVRMQRRNVMRYISGEGRQGTPGTCMVDLGNTGCVRGVEFIVYIPQEINK